ncbi:MAG: tRNA pseudouridine(38-40) synthase TruA [Candidatus Dependentiae bacterium]|nr:tRNA pseudouridine(38-40) synthase TruA [Candidatus Dependentiae bacterium]
MNCYRLLLAYDGTPYHGWQQQPDSPTVAGVLEEKFKTLFGHPISLLGASRTDAGVHALGQVARFYSPLAIESARWASAWNGVLPTEIKIRRIDRVADDFHPHRGVALKTYQYHIFTRRPLPFVARYGYFYPYRLDTHKLQGALARFVGTHNFWSFRVEGGAAVSDVCTVMAADYRCWDRFDLLQISFTGNRFLYHMVRRMMGAALAIAASPRRSIDEISDALGQQTPRDHFPTAPAHGLVLRRVVYNK